MDIYLVNSMRQEYLTHRLIQIVSQMQDVREITKSENSLSAGHYWDINAEHKQIAQELFEIFNEIGWPIRSEIGDQANDALKLITQHGIEKEQLISEYLQYTALEYNQGHRTNPRDSKL